MRSGRALRTGASVPRQSGCATLLVHGCLHQPGNSPTLYFKDVYESFIMQSVSSRSPSDGGGAESAKLLTMAWFFW